MLYEIHAQYGLFTQWLHLHPHLAGLATFIISFSESIAIIGSIVPGSVLMTAIGILIGSGIIPIWATFIWAILGALLGDSLSYFLGLYLKEGLQTIWPFTRYPRLLESGKNFFKKHGGKSVFIGRFAGPIRAIVPLIAGMLHLPPKRYYVANIPAAILWAPIYMLPGILLGAVSLEMPPDMATALIIAILLVLVAVWLLIKVSVYLYDKTHLYFAKLLDDQWNIWRKQPSKKWFCSLLYHAERPHQRGQVLLAINTFVALILFIIIFLNVVHHGFLLNWNHAIYHLFRGFRTPTLDKVMVVVSIFAYKMVLFGFVLVLGGYFLLRKRWLTAFHWFLGCGISAVLIEMVKHFYFSPRPPGIFSQTLESSFPSGHVGLAVTVYGLFTFLVTKQIKSKSIRHTIYWITLIGCILVGISRGYLNAHWLTDILAAALLGLFCLGITTISYQRHKPEKLSLMGVLSVAIIALAIFGGIRVYTHYIKDLKDSQIYHQIHLLSEKSWWTQTGFDMPYFRNNRLGHPTELLNIQWVGNLDAIQHLLQQHGWYGLHSRDYLTTLKEIAEENGVSYQPIFAKLYDDQHPVLTLIKFVNRMTPPLILRLWPANIAITPGEKPLWVGNIYFDIPKKHLFFFHHDIKSIQTTQAIQELIPSITARYIWQIKIIKPFQLPKNLVKTYGMEKVILIKPRK